MLPLITPGRPQSKTPILLRNINQKWLEIEFSIAICYQCAICRHICDKWQSKTLFVSIFDPRSSIVDSVFDCHLPCVLMKQIVKSALTLEQSEDPDQLASQIKSHNIFNSALNP